MQATNNPATCILQVRMIMRVLERFGYDGSMPISVGFQGWNAKLEAKLEANDREPANPEQAIQWRKEGAYIVEIDESQDADGYPGHLILKTRSGWLIDPSIDQASRPQYDLAITNWCERCPDDFPRPTTVMHRQHPNGAQLRYWVQDPPPKDFRTCPDWDVKLRDACVNLLVTMCVQDGALTKKELRIQTKRNRRKA